ncbi:hypothetical protein PDESU_06295 [Pontiella desulfatans]|uniref:VWFA domain-containing protein n=1 Tax=Pontiella desulfatans TaxID=2750659 RepID=A0A6C2UCW5_PONDE|nr:hypothetical protein [Pontiella desulfatans]VGO17693.1 hypothetical protein PDESU_06295 [Pontiella desulfatans]
MSKGKTFLTKHAKSSAALVSLGIHAVLVIVALSFVAVTVITKSDNKFEAKPVKRPKMQLKKLQVPVNIKKKKMQKPRLRKRIVVQPKVASMPDIKMPEITGVKGGMGSAGAGGLGGAGSLGFTMPEVELFGIKGKGEKVFIILDSTPWMMYDELGGIPAYTLIKEELVRILGELKPTVLFNVAVYGQGSGTHVLFPGLAPANAANIAKVDEWLKPLNAVAAGGYGTHTLGAGSDRLEENLAVEPLANLNHWSEPLMYAMKHRADTVFLLSNGWGHIFTEKAPAEAWSASKMAKYKEIEKKAMEKLAEENKERKANGQPERVLVGGSVINTYFPGTEHPPQAELYWYTPKEIAQSCVNLRKVNSTDLPKKSGLSSRNRKIRDLFAFNVIQFVPESGGQEEARFKELSGMLDGEYRSLPGLKAIESYLKTESGKSTK